MDRSANYGIDHFCWKSYLSKFYFKLYIYLLFFSRWSLHLDYWHSLASQPLRPPSMIWRGVCSRSALTNTRSVSTRMAAGTNWSNAQTNAESRSTTPAGPDASAFSTQWQAMQPPARLTTAWATRQEKKTSRFPSRWSAECLTSSWERKESIKNDYLSHKPYN